MKALAKLITRNTAMVLIISVALLLPSAYGYIKTEINYDILSYLPQDLDSTKGQNLLNDTFNNAATSMLIIENMESKDILKIKDKIAQVDGVEDVMWVNDICDISIPREIMPDSLMDTFYSGNTTMMIIKLKYPPASNQTLDAIGNIRKVLNKQCFLSGMAAIMKDIQLVTEKESFIYVVIAVALSLLSMLLTIESTVVPFVFMLGIFFAIAYNFGSNIIFGNICYVTKAIAAILQLAVTMDYSIFLLHRYDEEKEKFEDRRDAMAVAIHKTFIALSGSSLTTIAGFLALCFMKLKLGSDMGLVMAKGVVIGVICVVTVLPALVLVFDKQIHKYTHRTILPDFKRTAEVITGKYGIFVAIFLILFLPAIYGQSHVNVYYALDESLPKDLPSIVATNKLRDDYKMATTHFIIIDDKIQSYRVKEMIKKIENVDGVDKVIAYDKYVGSAVPDNFIPQEVKDIFKKGDYQMIMVNSKYRAARDPENAQIAEIIRIVKSYDKDGLVAGEGPLTKDLIDIADIDFKNTSIISIAAIFLIVMIVFKSISIPVLLVSAIELAIFINMAIPFYTGAVLPFIASIVIGCIQLGATVDYAILLTTRFQEELGQGHNKIEAIRIAVQGSAKSIITSALVMFSATVSVGIISKIEMIKSLCVLLSRGALISAAVIIFILPSLLVAFEGIISKTTMNWKRKTV